MAKIDVLRKIVFDKQTVLGRIYRDFGRLSLAEYAKGWQVFIPDGKRQEFDFLSAARQVCLELYGQETTAKVMGQLAESPLVSTIDHHGIFGHPFFLNSNLIFSLRSKPYLVCLPTESVSLNNNTSWSGCMLLTGPDGNPRRFSFFPDRIKTSAVLATKPLGNMEIQTVRHSISAVNFLSAEQKQKLLDLISEVIEQSDILGLPDFSSQASIISSKLWKSFFPKAPELIYLPLERLVKRFILTNLLGNTNHVLHELLFKTSGWELIEKYFHGSPGAFAGPQKGSFLFWGLDQKGRRIHLSRQGSRLIGENISIPAQASAILTALEQGQIYPTSLVCFLVLLCCGVTCLGGFNQVNWLSGIKQKFIELLGELGHKDLAGTIASVPTDNFGEAGLVFSPSAAGLYKPTALDLFLQGGDVYSKYIGLASKISLAESIDIQLPEIYKVITPALNRDPGLLD